MSATTSFRRAQGGQHPLACRADRARAGYQSLLTDYPGSPLVGDAKKKIALLAKKQAGAGDKP